MSEEPTFRIGETAWIKPGTIDQEGFDRGDLEVVVESARGDYLEAISGCVVEDGYLTRNAIAHCLVEHRFLYRKRPECDDKSNESFRNLLNKLKDTQPCEVSPSQSITSEPQEARLSTSSSINPAMLVLDALPSTMLEDWQRQLDLFRVVQNCYSLASWSTRQVESKYTLPTTSRIR